METKKPVPNRVDPCFNQAGGWTLVELMVALALLALLMVPVWMILASARNVSAELSRESPREADAALRHFEKDLFHTLRGHGTTQEPDFTLDPVAGAAWRRLARDPRGRVLPVNVAWIHDETSQEWMRVEKPFGGEAGAAVTNVMLRAVTEFTLEAGTPDDPRLVWPPDETATAPPSWVRVGFQLAGETEWTREMIVPAALTSRPPDPSEDP